MANTPNFQPGKIAKTFAGSTELPGFKWSVTDKAGTLELPNTRDGMLRIPGLEDAEGSFSLHVDAANFPTDAPPNLRAGVILVLQEYVTPSRFTSCTIILDEVTWSSEVAGSVDYEGKWKLQSGTLVYP